MLNFSNNSRLIHYHTKMNEPPLPGQDYSHYLWRRFIWACESEWYLWKPIFKFPVFHIYCSTVSRFQITRFFLLFFLCSFLEPTIFWNHYRPIGLFLIFFSSNLFEFWLCTYVCIMFVIWYLKCVLVFENFYIFGLYVYIVSYISFCFYISKLIMMACGFLFMLNRPT